MRHHARNAALLALTFAVGSCSDSTTLGPTPRRHGGPQFTTAASLPAVRISEFHYDNTGTDAGEAIEVSGPAGMDVTGWSVVLYNGNGGLAYGTSALIGTIPTTCDTRGVLVLNYAVNGIQNGSPDGIALVDASGSVVEFLSYEGTFAAVDGPAAGQTSTDVGVSELGTEPLGLSLQRAGTDVWSGPSANTFGACNDDSATPPQPTVDHVTIAPSSATIAEGATQSFTASAFDASNQPITGVTFVWSSNAPSVATVNASGVATGVSPGDATITATAPNTVAGSAALHVTEPPPPPNVPDTRFSEIHYDNFGTDANEAIEVEGPAATDLAGWSVVLYNGNGGVVYNTHALTGAIPDLCTGRGVVVVTYPQDGIQNGSPDGFALINAGGQVVEFLSYEGTFTATDGPAAGLTSIDIGASESSSPVGQSLQRDQSNHWSLATSSFGACFGGTAPPPGKTVSFSGRLPTDPALPVGFEDQLFATERDPSNVVIATTFTWSSETPLIASIDQNGVMHALTAGTATFRATAQDGTTQTYALPMAVATASATAQYGNNTEFGDPTDADPSDDFIIRRPQYTSSSNKNRNTPNWVSYDLEATHIGAGLDRCDCFTFDPALPADFFHYTTADYTGAGAIAGFGIDRGHLTRSFDRTAGTLDNARTFYFSNVVPQASDLNQGPWAALESYLGDLARFQDKEVYIITGPAGNNGTVKNEGKIVIPTHTWKVAVILPHDHGLADIHNYKDLDVVAVVMPNVPGIRNVNWETYKVTVDSVEALSGYDVLALLPDKIEIAVESGTNPPTAALDGPYSGLEGSSVSMSGAASSDLDGDALTYQWSFGDGASATGVSASHTYAQDGVYNVRLIVTDTRGIPDTATTTATIANVAPSVATFSGATLLPGETYTANGSFTDPGADAWTATVDYGDGGGVSGLSLSGHTFALSHLYNAAGVFTVTVSVSDDDVTTTKTQTVTVLTPAHAVEIAIGLVEQLRVDGTISAGIAASLNAKLVAAKKYLDAGDTTNAVDVLQSVISQIDALIRGGTLSPAQASELRTMVVRVLDSIA